VEHQEIANFLIEAKTLENMAELIESSIFPLSCVVLECFYDLTLKPGLPFSFLENLRSVMSSESLVNSLEGLAVRSDMGEGTLDLVRKLQNVEIP
jgi:hypothetical protein